MKVIDLGRDRRRASSSPPVTVIIPAYNAAGTIAKAIHSVATQTLLPLELICVDDLSTDHTRNVIRTVAGMCDFPVRLVLPTRNGGPGRARNIALSIARGSIAALLDADDTWCRTKLAVQLELFEKWRLDLLGGYSARGPIQSPAGDVEFERVSLAQALFKNPYHTSSVITRLSTAVKFPEDQLSEDYQLWLHLLQSGYRAGRHRQSLSSMFKHPFSHGGLSSSLLRMELGELRAISAVNGYARCLAGPAALVSIGKFGVRALRTATSRARSSTGSRSMP